jgi:hypothetical protein
MVKDYVEVTTKYRWKAEDVSFLHVLLVWGVKQVIFVK